MVGVEPQQAQVDPDKKKGSPRLGVKAPAATAKTIRQLTAPLWKGTSAAVITNIATMA